MITVDEYFQDSISKWDFTPSTEDYTRASDLLDRVNQLYADCELRSGHRTPGKTEELISRGLRAARGGQHEQSNAVDIADVGNDFDDALTDHILEAAGLYREDPNDTNSWSHLQRVAPPSGHRTFKP